MNYLPLPDEAARQVEGGMYWKQEGDDPHPFKLSDAEDELWPVMAERAKLLTEAPLFARGDRRHRQDGRDAHHLPGHFC